MGAWADEFKFTRLQDENTDAPKDTGSNGEVVVSAIGGRVFRRVQFRPFKTGEIYTKTLVAELNGVYVYFFEEGKRVVVTTEKLL